MTIHRMPMTEARIHLGELAKRAYHQQEYFIIEKDGIPVIGIMAAREMEEYLEMHDPKIKDQIKKSNEDIQHGRVRSASNFLTAISRKNKASRKKIK